MHGHVEENEEAKTAIIRECKEELGLTIRKKELHLLTTIYDRTDHKIYYFSIVKDIDIKNIEIQKEELSEVRWMTLTEIKDFIHQRPEEIVYSEDKLLLFALCENNR